MAAALLFVSLGPEFAESISGLLYPKPGTAWENAAKPLIRMAPEVYPLLIQPKTESVDEQGLSMEDLGNSTFLLDTLTYLHPSSPITKRLTLTPFHR